VPVAPSIVARTAMQTLGSGRVVTLATLRCPAGTACTVKAPARVTMTIAGKRFTLTVLAPKTIKAGASATLRVRVSAAAAKRLAGRTSTVTVKVSVAGATTTSRTVKVKVKRTK
jgi:predicted RecA/RadA family phage recombinase